MLADCLSVHCTLAESAVPGKLTDDHKVSHLASLLNRARLPNLSLNMLLCFCVAAAVADIACFPWVNALSAFYKADDALELASFKEVNAWLARCMERPASKVRVGGQQLSPAGLLDLF